MEAVFIIGMLSGYTLYHLFRNYIASKHRMLFGILNTIVIGVFVTGTLYFVVLYKEFPGYIGITVDTVSLVFGFIIGFILDKLSDKVVEYKMRKR